MSKKTFVILSVIASTAAAFDLKFGGHYGLLVGGILAIALAWKVTR